MSDLRMLAMPFPRRLIHDNPSGYGSYVPHHLYAQRLLLHLGGYSFTLVDVIRGDTAPRPTRNNEPPDVGLENVVVGVVARLTVRIDGEFYDIDEAGDCEMPANWPHDGARLKDAMSDALKRCCARIGLGTHLYAKTPDEFVLFDKLTERESDESPVGGGGPDGTHGPEEHPDPVPTDSETEDPGRPM